MALILLMSRLSLCGGVWVRSEPIRRQFCKILPHFKGSGTTIIPATFVLFLLMFVRFLLDSISKLLNFALLPPTQIFGPRTLLRRC